MAALTDFELVTGGYFGLEPGADCLEPAHDDWFEVSGDVLQPHLERGRCFVWMTGDEGCGLTLAAATKRARREGFDLPIPLTLVTESGAPDDEGVLATMRALGLTEWERVDATGRLGFLEPFAQEGLLRHGVRFPSIGHLIKPLAEAARGGSVIECHGTREVWQFWRGRRLRALFDGDRPSAREVGAALLTLSPAVARRQVVRRRWESLTPGHLRPAAHDWLGQQVETQVMITPMSASTAILQLHRRRCLWETVRTFAAHGADSGATIVHPFMEPPIVAAMAGFAGRRGWPTPRGLVEAVAPQLPPTTPRPVRPGAFWEGPATQAFIEAWDGTGLPEDLVDPELVREAWRSGRSRTGAMLQAAWLASPEGAAERAAQVQALA